MGAPDGLDRCDIRRYGTVQQNATKGRPDRPVADYVREEVDGRETEYVMLGRAPWEEAPPASRGIPVHPEELPHLLRQLRVLARDHFPELLEDSDDG